MYEYGLCQSTLEQELSSKRKNERYGALGLTQLEGRLILYSMCNTLNRTPKDALARFDKIMCLMNHIRMHYVRSSIQIKARI